eukprot:scaffold7755_cov104-Cylindrotheca_fusiformis.AAC.13
MTGDSLAATAADEKKRPPKTNKRKAKQKNGNGKRGVILADGTILDKPDYDWTNVEARPPKKPKQPQAKQKKARKPKSSKRKSPEESRSAMTPELENNSSDQGESMKLDPPPPPPTDPLSSLSLDNGDLHGGYAVPNMPSPHHSINNSKKLDSMLQSHTRQLSAGSTGDESIMSDSIMSESGWSDADSSTDSGE